MNYLAHLIRSKGFGQSGQRALSIARRYGVTSGKIVQAIERLIRTLEQYECRATFPVTAAALARHPAPICRLQEHGMEIAVHGWTHVDLGSYSIEQQREHLSRALDIFDRYGISAVGFRSPYLRRNDTIREVVEVMGFQYLSNKPILWDTISGLDWPGESVRAYQQAVDFYAPCLSAGYLSLPAVQGRIVDIPVSLPDDEMLVERLGANSTQIAQTWMKILHQTYAREELFTMQFHPERAGICMPALSLLLPEARSYSPPVWIARLDEVAEWWQQRLALRFDVTHEDDGQYHVAIQGPALASALVRSAQVIGESEVWIDGWQLVRSHCFRVRCHPRPFIGVSERADGSLISFLKQQGYLFEINEERAAYSIHLDRPNFSPQDEKALVQEIEASRSPLIRINRWPGGARSALAVTGDIDALTLWDYGLRLVGK